MGFDQPKSLGRNQTGAAVALPIWIGYMEKALKDVPEAPRTVPVGVVSVPVMGVLGEGRLAPEYFYQEAVPPPEVLQPIVPLVAPPGPGETPP
jgi:penicillin-binding protein 1A